MPQPDRAWWDDVQYLREPLERKREKEARRGLRLDARAAARAVADRHASAPAAEPELDFINGLDSIHDLDAIPRTRRFERSAPEDDGAPRRRFERSAPEDDGAHRGRFARVAPERVPDAKPRTGRFERSASGRRGRFARAERDTARDLAPEAPAAVTPAVVAAGHAPAGAAAADTPAAVALAAEAPTALTAPSRRRTVEITGRTVGAPSLPRLVQIDRRRPARRAAERVGARPDRLALWAVVLGFFLIFVAVTSTSHAATRAHSAGAASGRVVHQQVFHAHTAALRAIPPAR
jgi:hypothetical protein